MDMLFCNTLFPIETLKNDFTHYVPTPAENSVAWKWLNVICKNAEYTLIKVIIYVIMFWILLFLKRLLSFEHKFNYIFLLNPFHTQCLSYMYSLFLTIPFIPFGYHSFYYMMLIMYIRMVLTNVTISWWIMQKYTHTRYTNIAK